MCHLFVWLCFGSGRTGRDDSCDGGGRLNAEQAAALEEKSEQNPSDIATRTKILGYYFRKQYSDESARTARLALNLDNVEKAKQHLLAAGKTSGSPVLGSFGPNTTLANELLKLGEKEVVLEYFDLCSKFWGSGKDRLKQWSATVKAGGTPSFGGNLNY